MGIHWEDGGYSASVDIYVMVEGRRFDVAEIGPESIVLREQIDLQNGPAEIIIEVDGRKESHHVILYNRDVCSSILEYA